MYFLYYDFGLINEKLFIFLSVEAVSHITERTEWGSIRSEFYLREFNILELLYGLVVRLPGYKSRGPVLDSLVYQIFWVVVGLERGPLSLVRIMEDLCQGNRGTGLENRN
jgi:hypothetical protein